MRIWDVSEPIEPASATFPGDTPFTQQWALRIERGESCNVSSICMSVHLGTHTDAPLHFEVAGDDIAAVDLRKYIGRCRVIDVRGEGRPALVPVRLLTPELLRGAERLLLRTRSTHDHRVFDPDFTAVGPDAARALVAAGIVLVGIDTPSIDHASSKELDGHHALYAGGVAILENLDLSRVPAGDYELIALPLRIVAGDSSPVRAILRELPAEGR
ncbi:MAG TPA: arylformamidase [Planctomycetota bacterium]|nr:arylformamidase [Planctomycetota bacterium]